MTTESQNNESPILIKFESGDPEWYTMMPNILSYLTYKNEKGEIVRLSALARELYRVIKMAAGEEGGCWKSCKTLSFEANMSIGSVTNCKEELCQPMIELGGKSLIIIEKVHLNPGNGKRPNDIITIVDIWKESNAFKRKRNSKDPSSPGVLGSNLRTYNNPKTQVTNNQPSSPHELASSPGELNKNPINNNPYIETTNYPQVPSPSLVSSSFQQANANILPNMQSVGVQANPQAPRQVPAPKPNPKPIIPEKKTPQPENRVLAQNQTQTIENSLVSSSSSKIKALEELPLSDVQKKTIYSMKTDSKGNPITEERILKGISCLYEGIEDVGGFLYKAIYNNYERKMTEEDRKKIEEVNKKLEEEKRDKLRIEAIKIVEEIQKEETPKNFKLLYFKDRIEFTTKFITTRSTDGGKVENQSVQAVYYQARTFYEDFTALLKQNGFQKYVSRLA